MLVLTWNIAKRVRQLDGIAAAIRSRKPDLVALQEVKASAVPILRAALGDAGLTHDVTTLHRGKGNAIFSRWPLRAHRTGWAGKLPFPELLTGARVAAPTGDLELIDVHMPNGSGNGALKLDHFRALARHLAKPASIPRIVAGDFNSPRSEASDGTVLCFGGAYKSRGAEWEDAEQAIITGMAAFGMRDVFREKHGYRGRVGGAAYSHVTRGKTGNARRFDHVFASNELAVEDARYETKWLAADLSDHAALWARFR